MGVTNLWQVLSPVQVHTTLSSLHGKTLAVDLSIWVCEMQSMKQMAGVAKPYLRNLFFRVSSLLQLGVHLVFVIEGKAPELKLEVMSKRQGHRAGAGIRNTKTSGSRRNFNACLKECCEMLDYLGVPYIQSEGEAEAMCAYLNSQGLVDGCITNDGDAFLYGARIVYRNFTINSKDPHVECYKMDDIESELKIDRKGLIALGILVGCDYLPKGIPGIGIEKSVKLLQSLCGQDVLKRLYQWKTLDDCQCLNSLEAQLRRKAVVAGGFPYPKVIEEFLVSKNKCPKNVGVWKRPIVHKMQMFCLKKLEWVVDYSFEKVLPLLTLWDMMDRQRPHPFLKGDKHIQPSRIVKARVRQGQAVYEVEWNLANLEFDTAEELNSVTFEEQCLFSECFPKIVETFVEAEELKKKAKGKRNRKKNKPALENVDIECPNDEETHSLPSEQNKETGAQTMETQLKPKEDQRSSRKAQIRKKSRKGNDPKAPDVDGLEAEMEKMMISTSIQRVETPSSQHFSFDKDVPSSNVKSHDRLTDKLGRSSSSGCHGDAPSSTSTVTEDEFSEEDEALKEYLPLSQRIKLNIQSLDINKNNSGPGSKFKNSCESENTNTCKNTTKPFVEEGLCTKSVPKTMVYSCKLVKNIGCNNNATKLPKTVPTLPVEIICLSSDDDDDEHEEEHDDVCEMKDMEVIKSSSVPVTCVDTGNRNLVGNVDRQCSNGLTTTSSGENMKDSARLKHSCSVKSSGDVVAVDSSIKNSASDAIQSLLQTPQLVKNQKLSVISPDSPLVLKQRLQSTPSSQSKMNPKSPYKEDHLRPFHQSPIGFQLMSPVQETNSPSNENAPVPNFAEVSPFHCHITPYMSKTNDFHPDDRASKSQFNDSRLSGSLNCDTNNLSPSISNSEKSSLHFGNFEIESSLLKSVLERTAHQSYLDSDTVTPNGNISHRLVNNTCNDSSNCSGVSEKNKACSFVNGSLDLFDNSLCRSISTEPSSTCIVTSCTTLHEKSNGKIEEKSSLCTVGNSADGPTDTVISDPQNTKTMESEILNVPPCHSPYGDLSGENSVHAISKLKCSGKGLNTSGSNDHGSENPDFVLSDLAEADKGNRVDRLCMKMSELLTENVTRTVRLPDQSFNESYLPSSPLPLLQRLRRNAGGNMSILGDITTEKFRTVSSTK